MLVLACFLLTMISAHAQSTYASIGGLVTDSLGAVVADAAVTVFDTGTAVEYKTRTNRQGNYRVSFLKPGDYIVHIDKTGFEQYSTSSINWC
jgi:hypothetical protein